MGLVIIADGAIRLNKKIIEHPGSLLLLIFALTTLLNSMVFVWFGVENQLTGVLDGDSIADAQSWVFRWNISRFIVCVLSIALILIGTIQFTLRWKLVFWGLVVTTLITAALILLTDQQLLGNFDFATASTYAFLFMIMAWITYGIVGGIVLCSIIDLCVKSPYRGSWLHWFGVATYLISLFLPNILLAVASRYLSVEQIYNL